MDRFCFMDIFIFVDSLFVEDSLIVVDSFIFMDWTLNILPSDVVCLKTCSSKRTEACL